VFFDIPGPPWPEHGDRCIPYLIRNLRDVQGVPIHQIRDRVIDHAREHDLSINQEMQTLLERYLGNGRRGAVERVRAADDDVVVEGTVRIVNSNVNLMQRFEVPDTAMARAMLGDMARQRYCELTIRVSLDNETRFLDYVCFVPQQMASRSRVRVGSEAFAVLEPRRVGNARVWIANELQV
jgi:hypothetical protein